VPKTVGVVLSGCGFQDGTEIHEAVIALLALDRAGARIRCFAPDVTQTMVVDHRSGKAIAGAERNALAESARIARGQIQPLASAGVDDLDALLFVGGYGAALNVSDFAQRGEQAVANPDAVRIIRAMHQAGKPLGFMCIAPAVAAAAFRGTPVHPRLTIGTDPGTSAKLEKMGARPVRRAVDEIEVDPENRIVSTPAYMLAERISEAAAGIDKLVQKLLEMA
jgi:enhancing lycopene biosynthesis protein 2